jgi:Cdc6-like AAA superfamily ATPase
MLVDNFEKSYPLNIIIKGERGIGKTSTLLFLGKTIRDLKNPNFIEHYSKGVGEEFSNPFKLIHEVIKNVKDVDYSSNILNEDKMQKSYSAFQEETAHYLAEKNIKYYMLIDVPDFIGGKYYKEFYRTLEWFVGCKQISIIIAMNESHYVEANKVTENLGKFQSFQLRRFKFNEMLDLVSKRLDTVRETNKKNPTIYYPFTEESLKLVHSVTDGIPRNILSACNQLFFSAHLANSPKIDEDFASNVLRTTYVDEVLSEGVKDETLRNTLKITYEFLKGNGGFFPTKEGFVDAMQKAIKWNRLTILKKVQYLEELGIIRIRTNEQDNVSKEIRTVV